MNTYAMLGLPSEVQVLLCVLTITLFLTPYLSGTDLGILKIPVVGDAARVRLKWIGPALLAILIVCFLPLWADADKDSTKKAGPDPLQQLSDQIAKVTGQLDTLSNLDNDLEAVRKLEPEFKASMTALAGFGTKPQEVAAASRCRFSAD